ncbi:MAG: Nitroreductase [Parcubacteria group bacterium GW2011_GWC1_38_6]|nr:MAG: Nitroreductase [Parcubacteria group bacterium GW2011_GWA1_36_12]KKQ77501.1 MAG: Nitroreductase [Parcubacteria group bacterium GW2011_GWC1_38_6]
MQEDIKRILEIATNAPSGSNSQPWQFKVRGKMVNVIALPQKDHPVLNYRNRGTWIAHGALIENIDIVASSFGYGTEIKIFPDKNQPNITAGIGLVSGLPKADPLFSVVPLRTINRKKYEDRLLDDYQKQELFKSVESHKNIELKFTEDKEQCRSIGEALAVNEIVTLETKRLHKLFFDEIVWSREEELKRKSGLYIKTMELKPPQQAVLRLLENWRVMQFLNQVKFASVIAKDNSRIYSSGAGIGIIVVKNNDEDFLLAGRVMERLWLEATQMRLSFHLITGTMFFWQGIQNDAMNIFSPDHVKIVNDAYNKITKVFNIKQGIIALAFRVGFDGEPSALSSKKPPEIL